MIRNNPSFGLCHLSSSFMIIFFLIRVKWAKYENVSVVLYELQKKREHLINSIRVVTVCILTQMAQSHGHTVAYINEKFWRQIWAKILNSMASSPQLSLHILVASLHHFVWMNILAFKLFDIISFDLEMSMVIYFSVSFSYMHGCIVFFC